MSKIDKVFSEPLKNIDDFNFDDRVAEVFPDMIRRSVPGYESIIRQLGTFARLFVTDNSRVYDLGSSLGAATLSMRRGIETQNVQIIAVDNSKSMIERSQKILAAYDSEIPVQLIQDDIENVAISNASMVVLNFTLQFIDKNNRALLLEKIFEGLNPGGLLVLSEKIYFENPVTQKTIDDMHLDFKRENGYSELEISQKREALQDILVPESLDEHKMRLLDAGFRSADVWYQQYSFASIVAIK
ncbi:MAG: carboxy-S-adenosyl-L-methionine synthase CmoA [Gammaproteobacteria bacterium]|nr:MAG: carboxy-S-adenosyl-L-methionine synthase CmoA [Gammaproteobacteria bacterium]